MSIIKSSMAKLDKLKGKLEGMKDDLKAQRKDADKQLAELNENRMTIGGFPLVTVLDNDGQAVTFNGRSDSVRISPMEYEEGNKAVHRKAEDIKTVYTSKEEAEYSLFVMRSRSDKTYTKEQFEADKKKFFEEKGHPFDLEEYIKEHSSTEKEVPQKEEIIKE